MKSLKKLLSIFAAFMMVVGLTAANVKAEGNASITVENATLDKTYTIYKLLDKDANTNYYYTENETTANLFKNAKSGQKSLFTVVKGSDNKFNVYVADGVSNKEVIDWVKENINSFTPGETKTATSATVTFEKLDPGYYYITTNNGAAVTIDSVSTTEVVKDKNPNDPTIPNQPKKILVNGEEVLATSDQIGKTVSYQIKFTATNFRQVKNADGTLATETDGTPKYESVTKYVVTDTPTGLSINTNSVAITVAGVELASNAFTAAKVGDGVEITIPWVNGDAHIYGSPADVVITYTATLTALTGTNSATVKINDDTTGGGNETNVKTVDATINKVDKDNNQLTGAEFKVYEADETTLIKFTKDTDGNYVVNPSGDIDTLTNLGVATIKGLKAETTYYLEETKAPAGYNILKDKKPFTTNAVDTTAVSVFVENLQGSELPSTGGMGTTMLYVAGAILMVGAAVIFVTNKRMKHE